jgi:hypothetical protein
MGAILVACGASPTTSSTLSWVGKEAWWDNDSASSALYGGVAHSNIED